MGGGGGGEGGTVMASNVCYQTDLFHIWAFTIKRSTVLVFLVM